MLHDIIHNIKEHITEKKQEDLRDFEFTQSDYNLESEVLRLENLIASELTYLLIDEDNLYET